MVRKQSGITRQKWTERGGVPRKGFRVDFSLLRDVSASKRTGSEAAVSCHSTIRPLMVLRFYDPLMVNNHDRLEPVTVINFSEFERSFSPFHLSGDCRNGAAFGSNGYKKRRIAVYRLFSISLVFLCGERNLEDKGFNRNVLMAALSVDKTEIAKLLSVARSIPTSIVQAIGHAPKAGRPRWIALSKLVNSRGKEKKIEGIIASESFRALGSDRKFDALFAAISESRKDDRPIDHWADPKGRRIVRVERGLGRTKLFFDERLEPNFGAHVVDNLSKLYSEFKSRGGED